MSSYELDCAFFGPGGDFNMAQPQPNYYRAPKRRIEKTYSVIGSQSITNSQTTHTLHVAEDAKTLVRAIIQLVVTDDNQGSAGWMLGLMREPNGVASMAVAPGQALAVNYPQDVLWMYRGQHNALVVQGLAPCYIFADIKGQRKLKPGDEITLKTMGDLANGSTVSGIVTLFFKE